MVVKMFRSLGLEQKDRTVTEVEVDEVLRLCEVREYD